MALFNQHINPSTLQLINYLLNLGDNALILGHKNSEWCGHGPVLEQDIAITNISLDLIGQARNFYQYAAKIINESKTPLLLKEKGLGDEVTEDHIAYLRDAVDFKNILLVEQPNGDWACTILRQFLCSTYQKLLYNGLLKSSDQQIAAISEKSLKEVNYHVKWAAEWVIRLGDGTVESRQHMLQAIDDLWMYTTELFEPTDYENWAATNNIGVDVSSLYGEWMQQVKNIFTEATLPIPEQQGWQKGGKTGVHTEHLSYILTALQYMQRAYPNCVW